MLRMKKLEFLLVLLFLAFTTNAQNIVVETIRITNTVDKENHYSIPKLKDLSNARNAIVDKINSYLLETFDITSYNQSEIDEFRWSDLDFDSEVKSGIAYIHYGGEY